MQHTENWPPAIGSRLGIESNWKWLNNSKNIIVHSPVLELAPIYKLLISSIKPVLNIFRTYNKNIIKPATTGPKSLLSSAECHQEHAWFCSQVNNTWRPVAHNWRYQKMYSTLNIHNWSSTERSCMAASTPSLDVKRCPGANF